MFSLCQSTSLWSRLSSGLFTVYYSLLSITAGSIRIARVTAGAAARATANSNTTAGNAIIDISVPFTPYSSDATNAPTQGPASTPPPRPAVPLQIPAHSQSAQYSSPSRPAQSAPRSLVLAASPSNAVPRTALPPPATAQPRQKERS